MAARHSGFLSGDVFLLPFLIAEATRQRYVSMRQNERTAVPRCLSHHVPGWELTSTQDRPDPRFELLTVKGFGQEWEIGILADDVLHVRFWKKSRSRTCHPFMEPCWAEWVMS